MQIFRVHENHKISAQFLDNRRLSKQVLEMYQIIRVCLGAMDIIDTNTRYLSHPIVKTIYNAGHPYLIDAYKFLQILDEEHKRRGGKRSAEFEADIDNLRGIIETHQSRFNYNKIPPYFVYGEERIYGETAYDCYEKLLFDKWGKDKIPPRCNIKCNQV